MKYDIMQYCKLQIEKQLPKKRLMKIRILKGINKQIMN